MHEQENSRQRYQTVSPTTTQRGLRELWRNDFTSLQAPEKDYMKQIIRTVLDRPIIKNVENIFSDRWLFDFFQLYSYELLTSLI